MRNHLFSNLRFLFSVFVLCSTALAIVFPLHPIRQSRAAETNLPSNEPRAKNINISFEENRGQFDQQVRYFSRGNGFGLFLTATEAVYVLPISKEADKKRNEETQKQIDESASPLHAFALRMKIVGANAESAFSGEEIVEQRTNYFKGGESNWRTNIPNFGAIRYENVYEGVGMIWHGAENGAARYDFIVQPNADPEQIALEFDGADNIEIDAEGNLLIYTAAGTIKQAKPFSYQENGGIKQEIESSFRIENSQIANPKSQIKFSLGDYDRSKPLTIDPTVTLNNQAFGTMLGAFADEFSNDIAVDANGNTYITGRTLSPAFPTTAGVFDPAANGAEDVFVTKLNASGTGIVFSTFLGGSNYDEGLGIAVDAGGNVFVAGSTAGGGFPTTAGAFDTTFNGGADAFAAKLNSNGSALIYSTYIGAVNFDSANDLAIDSNGNAYLAVRTSDNSPALNYPTTPGAFDTTHNGFDDVAVTKLNADGSALIYSTFLGGSSIDVPRAIAVNASGEVFVSGSTTDDAVDFPTTAGAYDPTHNGVTDFFVTKLNANGTNLIYSTFIGGAGIDNGNAMAIDAAGAAYIAGVVSPGFPTTAGVFDTTIAGSNEIGLSKLSADGSTLVYSTFIGGTQSETPNALAVDFFGNAYIAGSNFGGDYPTTAGVFDTTFNGSSDAIFSVVNQNASALIYSTYLGGAGTDVAQGIALDATGNVYLTGRTAVGGAIAFPTTPQAFQSFNAGGSDAFIVKFGNFVIGGKVIDPNGAPLSNVQVAMSGVVSGNVLTGADGRFGFTNTALNQPHVIAASRSGYSINPALFNIASLNGNRELIFIGTVGSPTGGAGGTLRFQNLSYTKSENGAFVTATVTRAGALTSSEPVTVDFHTMNGTAIAGQDYVQTNGVLTFHTLETSKTIHVPLVNDATLEPRENFSIVLSNPTNHAEIEPNREKATIHILDEDLGAGDLLISEFRQRGRLGANDEYIKLFNPNDFDVTVNTADDSAGLTLARANGANAAPIVTIPNFVTIAARGHYLLTNNHPSGGFSLIDYPTGTGTTTAVGDQTFSNDIPDNSSLILMRTANPKKFNAENLLDAVGFGSSVWSEGHGLPVIGAENSETCFVRRLTADGLLDTGDNLTDFLLVDNHARAFVGENQTKILSALGSPAPETSESLRLMKANEVSIEAFGAEIFDWTPQPNGRFGTLTIYRRITNHTDQPILALRLRAIDFPTIGSASQRRFPSRPDFRLFNSFDEGRSIKGVSLAAEHLQPNGGGINSTLTVDAITANNPLNAGESVVVAIRFGIMRHGRRSFTAAVEALQ